VKKPPEANIEGDENSPFHLGLRDDLEVIEMAETEGRKSDDIELESFGEKMCRTRGKIRVE
jgi:hypothetical protein